MIKVVGCFGILVGLVFFINSADRRGPCPIDFAEINPDPTFYYIDTVVFRQSIGKSEDVIHYVQKEYLEKVNSLHIDSSFLAIAHSDCRSSFCQEYLGRVMQTWQSDEYGSSRYPYFFNGRFLVDSLLAICARDGYHISDPLRNQEYIDALDEIGDLDQLYRRQRLTYKDNSNRQAEVDSINRVKLDSLFSRYGFPHVYTVGYKGHEIAWRVLHHSGECDWNKKWFPRFLEDYYSYPFEGYSMYRTYDRFYELENGWCEGDREFILSHLLRSGNTELERLVRR